MKQTLITRLVLGAIAGMAAMSANAGQITASSTNVAREVITTDTQVINSPTISYRFAGDINATVQAQEFQVQFTLEDGANWAGLPTDDAITITPTVGTNAGFVGVGGVNFTVLAKGFDNPTNPTVLWATLSVPVTAAAPWTTSLLDQPIVTLNAATATTPAKINKLKTLVGDLVNDFNTAKKCFDSKNLSVNFKHFKLLSNPSAIAGAGNGVADEHERAGATNRAGIANFPTNIKINTAASSASAKLANGGNLTFVYAGGLPGGVVGVAGGVSNASWTGLAADPVGTTNLTVNLGTVSLAQNATGYDSDLATQYLLTALETDADAADSVLGFVEASPATNVVVTSSNGFVKGGTLELRSMPAAAGVGAPPAPACSGVAVAGSAIAIDTDAKAAATSLTLPVAAPAAAFGAAKAVQVCYTAPGTTNIPAASFSAVTTLAKAPAGGDNAEQNNVCDGNLYSLGGGLKIDVRNYASSKETSGYQSVIRLINNSDVRTADVYGQIIHQNGQFGGYGLLATLKPREVLNMTAAQVDAKLINAPAAATAADNGASAPVASATGAPRLRITSNSGASLRVQNYLFNSATQQIFEASNGQGVDFEGTSDRAPAADGQYISQDANSGLNGK